MDKKKWNVLNDNCSIAELFKRGKKKDAEALIDKSVETGEVVRII